ncbi:MAG TPA: alpha/beta hydrolase [Polyangiaceae bacterium]|nr:alpha/beta hydrolase [Polyangiaceae bacterium]
MHEQLVDLGPPRNGLRLNVRLAGPATGPTLVLLHGFPETWWSWRHQIEVLAAAGMRVIAPDLRGAGKSDISGPYELADLADDIRALLGVLTNGAPTLLAGHDWGGATAWTFARRNPELVSRLVVLNSCLPERLIEAISTRFSLKQFAKSWYILLFQIPLIPDWLLSRDGGALVKTIIRKGMKDSSRLTDADLAPFCLAATRPGGATGMLGPYRAVFRRALSDLVGSGNPFPDRPNIRCPTLLIWGDADPAQGVELVRGMETTVPNLRILRLPACGHFPQSEDPGAVNDAILAFLKG